MRGMAGNGFKTNDAFRRGGFLLLAALALACGRAWGQSLPPGFAPGTLAVPVEFSNATQGERPDSNIYINFVGGGLPTNPADPAVFDPAQAIGYYYNGVTLTTLYTNSSVSLTNIIGSGPGAAPTIYLYGWDSGRLYISYGSAMTGLSPSYTPTSGPYEGWQPPPASPDPNFQIRHQAMELTVIPQSNTGLTAFTNVNQLYSDISYIDYTAISLGSEVINPTPTTKNPVQWSDNTSQLLATVGETNPGAPTYTPNSNILTSGTLTGGAPIVQVAGQSTDLTYSNPVNFPAPNGALPSPNFLRVTGPGSMGTIGSASGATAFYHDWSAYMGALQTGGSLNPTGSLVTTLSGTNATLPYNMTATFNGGTIVINGVTYTGYVHIAGTINSVSHTIDIPYSEMEKSTGVYGENPNYSIDGAPLIPPPNNIYTWVVGDLLTGMNFGFVGSATQNPLLPGTSIGATGSSQWWALGSYNNGSLLFGGSQSNPDFYNTYAAGLAGVTSAYGFAYEDRLGDNTTNFTLDPSTSYTNAELNVLIQPDFALVPEPSTWALLGCGAGVFLFAGKRFAARRSGKKA